MKQSVSVLSREGFSLFAVSRRVRLEKGGCSPVPGTVLCWETCCPGRPGQGGATVRVGRRWQERSQPLREPGSCSQGESAREKRSIHTALNGCDPAQREGLLSIHTWPLRLPEQGGSSSPFAQLSASARGEGVTCKRDPRGHDLCPLTASLPESEGRGADERWSQTQRLPPRATPGPLKTVGLVSPPAEQGGSRSPVRVRERSACAGPPRPPCTAPRVPRRPLASSAESLSRPPQAQQLQFNYCPGDFTKQISTPSQRTSGLQTLTLVPPSETSFALILASPYVYALKLTLSYLLIFALSPYSG